MGLADIIVIFLLTYYSIYISKMIFNKSRRKGVQVLNQKLDKIRTKPLKTLEEQKEFINLKYPKSGKFKWQWIMIPKVLFAIFLYLIVFRTYLWLWGLIGIQLKLWHAIIVIVLFPMTLNYILEKFNIQKGDLRYMLRW